MVPASTIRLDEGIREETTRIAAEMGLSFNAVMNILARKFNAEKVSPFPVRLETEKRPFTICPLMNLRRLVGPRSVSDMKLLTRISSHDWTG